MSCSPPSPTMAFTFGTHQSTTPLVFCREINAPSTLCRKRALADPSPSGPSHKRRRLRLSLTTSPLSLPFSTPRASSQPDRTSSRHHHHRSTAVFILRPSQRRLPRPLASASSSSSASSCSVLRKAAVLNRVQQRLDAACQRNPNLRWEKEKRQEHELLLKEGVQLRRMAAVKDGLLSSDTSTCHLESTVGDVVSAHYCSDPRRRPAATSHVVEDGDAAEPHAAAAAASIWFSNKIGYPVASAVGLSNYDALDLEEEEKDDAVADTPVPESAGVVDEGMRDIFDFLTPPATHHSFLSDFGGEGDDDDDAAHIAPCSSPGPSPLGSASGSASVRAEDANDADNDIDAVGVTAGGVHRVADLYVGGRLTRQHARAVPPTFQRCQSASVVSRHQPSHHRHHRRHDRQHHCAMAAAAAAAASSFVARPHAY